MHSFGKPNPFLKNSYEAIEFKEAFSSTNLANQDMSLGHQTSTVSQTNQSIVNAAEVGTTSDDKAERKRQRDREYRERCKKLQRQMGDRVKILAEQNECLRKENESFKFENARINQTVGSQTEVLKQLRNDCSVMKLKHEKQGLLLQTLLSKLANYDMSPHDIQLVNQKLKVENVKLRKNAEISDHSPQVMVENLNLQLENKALKVKVDALCETIARKSKLI